MNKKEKSGFALKLKLWQTDGENPNGKNYCLFKKTVDGKKRLEFFLEKK